jgi:hypothetical protein
MSQDPFKEFRSVVDLRRARVQQVEKKSGFSTTSFAEMEVVPTTWLWHNRVAHKSISLIQGTPEVGKSLVVVDWVAALSQGRPFPGDRAGRKPERSLWVTTEESPTRAILPRLIAAGADLSMIENFDYDPRVPGTEMTLPSRAADFERWIKARRDAGSGFSLLIWDGLSVILDDKLSSNSEQHVRKAMSIMGKICEAQDFAFIGIRHLAKNNDGGSPTARGAGAQAWTATARSELLVGRHPEDDKKRVIARVKSNDAPDMKSWSFQVVGVDVEVSPGVQQNVPKIEWLEECEVTARELLSAMDGRSKGPSARDIKLCRESVLKFLKFGAASEADLWKNATGVGHSRQAFTATISDLRRSGLAVYNEARLLEYVPPVAIEKPKKPRQLSLVPAPAEDK